MSQFDPAVKRKGLGDVSINVINTSGPSMVSEVVFKYLKNPEFDSKFPNVIILPKHYFYPISNNLRKEITEENYEKLIKEQVTN